MSTRYVWGKYNIETSVQETKEIISPIRKKDELNVDKGIYDYRNRNTVLEGEDLYYDIIHDTDLSSIFNNGVTKSFTLSNMIEEGEVPSPIVFNPYSHGFIIFKKANSVFGNGNIPSGLSSIYVYEINNKTGYDLTLNIWRDKSSNRYDYWWWYTIYISSTEECNYVKLGYTGSNTQGSLIEYLATDTSGSYPTDTELDGYWYTYKGSDNIDPTAIRYPSTIKSGQSITLTTTESNDIKYGGTITYTYEVQLNGGRWTSIGSTTSLRKSYRVPAGTTTFRARVIAKDNYGFTSTTYVTGNTVSVTNNVAPSTPSSISVPSNIQAGKAFTVSWGASTDADGNLSGYTLQRKLNSGAYTTVYTGSSRSYQDTIPKSGYTSVIYRVQAYDTDGATSSYRTSSTVTVINNVAPVISGSDSNLGSFTYNPPTISYSITDSNNDAVTATIKLNSSIIETKNISLGQTYTVSIDWWNIDAGSHTLTITATDGKGGTATRKYTFNKKSVGLISFNRLRKKIDTGYQTTYIETDSDSIITNNGQILSERLTDIASKLSISIDTTPSEMVLRHRLHIKLTSEYTIDYLEMYSTNVKVGSSTLEEVLVRLETKVGISNGGIVPSDLNFERWRMKNSSGGYDIIYLEGVSEHIICPCGKTVEDRLVAIEAKL